MCVPLQYQAPCLILGWALPTRVSHLRDTLPAVNIVGLYFYYDNYLADGNKIF